MKIASPIHIAAVCCLLFFTKQGIAQQDSIVLSYAAFIENILQYHPVARQAALQNDFAAVEKLAAKGRFDPQLAADWNDKYFDKKHYYRIFNAGFQIPTWYGLTLNGSYENTDGVYLNPENTTTNMGLWTLGVEANLLQGLLIDERRAAVQQARVFQQAAANEQKRMLNELLFAASLAYVNWQAAFNTQRIIEESMVLAREYLSATRESFFNGDKPAIDTLEAFMIVQDRQLRLQANAIDLVKTRQHLENFLWYEQLPIELKPATTPEPMQTGALGPPFVAVPEPQLENHPEILEKQFKITQYEIEQRLKRDKFKPKLKVKYNPLLATSDNSVAPEFMLSNYKWGLGFAMPLLFRSERAAVQKTSVAIRELELGISDKQNNLRNKLQANREIQAVLREQVGLQQQNVANAGTLLEAENEKYSIGESSVFLLNKRAEKLLETRIKLVELTAKYQGNQMEYFYVAGNFVGAVAGTN
ncbi:MAG: TolC family protein [Lewinellaceae bacterium]|nr:TolC family protein [Lewinellaceae bacterium]